MDNTPALQARKTLALVITGAVAVLLVGILVYRFQKAQENRKVDVANEKLKGFFSSVGNQMGSFFSENNATIEK